MNIILEATNKELFDKINSDEIVISNLKKSIRIICLNIGRKI